MAAKINPATGLTEKQHAFCKAYLKTGNATEAYRTAYNAHDWTNDAQRVAACRMMKNANIQLTLERMRNRMNEKHMVSLDSLTNELEEIRADAKKDGKYSAAVTAVMGKARIHGLDIQQVKVTHKHETTPEERIAMLQAIIARSLPAPEPLTIDQEAIHEDQSDN